MFWKHFWDNIVRRKECAVFVFLLMGDSNYREFAIARSADWLDNLRKSLWRPIKPPGRQSLPHEARWVPAVNTMNMNSLFWIQKCLSKWSMPRKMKQSTARKIKGRTRVTATSHAKNNRTERRKSWPYLGWSHRSHILPREGNTWRKDFAKCTSDKR